MICLGIKSYRQETHNAKTHRRDRFTLFLFLAFCMKIILALKFWWKFPKISSVLYILQVVELIGLSFSLTTAMSNLICCLFSGWNSHLCNHSRNHISNYSSQRDPSLCRVWSSPAQEIIFFFPSNTSSLIYLIITISLPMGSLGSVALKHLKPEQT